MAADKFDRAALSDLAYAPWKSLPDLTRSSEPGLRVSSTNWLVQPSRYPGHAAMLERCAQLMGELVPIPSIAERIQDFQAKCFRPVMIGAHVRRGDMVSLRPDITANLQAVVQVVERWLAAWPNAGVFLCTDDGAPDPETSKATRYEGVRERFVERFGDRVVFTRPRSMDRQSPEAIEDAVVDLMLLRQTDFLVGTAFSSFSELAGFGRSIPLVMTADASESYKRAKKVLTWMGIDALVSIVSQREFGAAMPYPFVLYRIRLRMRSMVRRFSPHRRGML